MNISCMNEYDILKTVILCEPTYLSIDDPHHKEIKERTINTDLALKQHRHFVRALKDQGVEVILLNAEKTFTDQVFTRDVGFTVGEKVYVAELDTYLRQGEENALIQLLNQLELPSHLLTGIAIEGGDVIIDNKTIYVGLSTRTDEQAVTHLKTILPHYEILPIPFNDTFLHLDCVFNILSPTEAIICSDEINSEQVKHLKSRYELIEVIGKEKYTHGTNILSIGNKKVFSLPINKDINEKLRARGYEVIEVDITEITKSGGAFRCCTLPISRVRI